MELTAADLQEGPRAADGQEVSTAVEPTAADGQEGPRAAEPRVAVVMEAAASAAVAILARAAGAGAKREAVDGGAVDGVAVG